MSSHFVRVLRAQSVYDTIIRHGTVVDGSGRPRFPADVAIAGGVIAAVGDLATATATAEIDATGLFVAPGFINIHSHASLEALSTAENMLTQGVTTEILNPDGGGPTDLAEQMRRVAMLGTALNVGPFIGFNSAWTQVMGPGDRRATDDDIANMRALIVAGLEYGAWGVSAGLDYKPAYYAQIEEVVRAIEPAGAWRTIFPNHDRLTPEAGFSSRVGVGETIAIGERAGLSPLVTHMKSQGVEQGQAARLLSMMDAATKRGHYTPADAYPYLAGQTGLGALMVPAWAQDGGREKMLERFKDPAARARVVAEIEQAMKARFSGAAGVYLPATKRQLVDVMREEHASAGETVVRLLERGNMSAILTFGREEDLVKILQYPATSIACDCGATTDTRQHPRAWGTFPRVLGHYVRETKALTWEDAIRKMTALPAARIGMVDRGFLAPGTAADIAIFDPRTIIDRATYEDAGQLSEGVRFVLVNGQLALKDGTVTGTRAGRTLLRTRHMPARRMPARAGRVSTRGMAGNVPIDIDVRQTAAGDRPTGVLKIAHDAAKGQVIEATEFGLLQTAGKWSTFTAHASVGRSPIRKWLVVIIDGSDPSRAGTTHLTVLEDGRVVMDAVLQ